jgi:putative DNA primase/helicase
MSLEDKRDEFLNDILTGDNNPSLVVTSQTTGLVIVTNPSLNTNGDGNSMPQGYIIGSNPKKNSKPYKAGKDGDEAEKESKLAGAIADQLKDILVYDEIGGDWYGQKNGLWSVVTEKRALRIIMQVLDKKQPFGYAISKLNNIKSFLMIYLLNDKWANSRHLLPMSNGILDTQTMQLIEYSHKQRFNWQLPYAYEPDAKIDVTKRWLWDASGEDLESVNIIRAFFKMALVGGDIQKFLELIGGGGTGKSTLTRLLVALIGTKNHTVTELKQLETNQFEAAGLYGKRLVLINDSSRYGGEVSVLKALTGGDPIRLEKKNVQQGGSFIFDGVVVIASNEPIQTADYTSGLIRRRMPVNFNRKVTDADKLKWASVGGLEVALHNELAGLLNWVLAMTDAEVRLAIGGINGEMTRAQREHLVETNKIAAWIDENLIINPMVSHLVGVSMKKKSDYNEVSMARREKLYPNYEAWCDDGNVNPIGLQRFSNNIMDVCGQLKIILSDKKTNKGKSLTGLEIRKDHHVNHATPITKNTLSDGTVTRSDDRVTATDRVSDEVTTSDDLNSSVTNQESCFEDSEVF